MYSYEVFTHIIIYVLMDLEIIMIYNDVWSLSM